MKHGVIFVAQLFRLRIFFVAVANKDSHRPLTAGYSVLTCIRMESPKQTETYSVGWELTPVKDTPGSNAMKNDAEYWDELEKLTIECANVALSELLGTTTSISSALVGLDAEIGEGVEVVLHERLTDCQECDSWVGRESDNVLCRGCRIKAVAPNTVIIVPNELPLTQHDQEFLRQIDVDGGVGVRTWMANRLT